VAIKCPKCQAENPETQRYCGECGTQLPAPQTRPTLVTQTLQTPIRELTTGSTFAGRYQVIEELGHGGMGKVYKVFDTKIKEKVALKLIKPEIASDKETIERFGNELRLARKISQRNVCRMFDMGEAEGAHFITMEYVSGEDLKTMIRMASGLSIGAVLSIGKQVCDGLAEAHSLGVVHRDLKPQNIMIDKGGNAKIMDFGIARSIREKGITGPSVLIGTPEYMSPEQAEAKEIDQRSDIYSLGIILYEMTTGRPPFEGDTALSIAMKHKGESPKNPNQLNPNIPDSLSGVILKCLEKDRAKRIQTTDELRSELEKIEKGMPTTELVVPRPKSITSKEIRVKFTLKKLFVPALAGIAAVIGALIIWNVVLKKPITLLPEQKRSVAVVNFENQTGDNTYDYLSKVIPNLLITNLEQSGYFDVTTWERIRDLLKQVGKGDAEFIDSDLGFELCQEDGVEIIILGSVTKADSTFVTDAKVLEVGTKKLLATANSRGDGASSILRTQIDDLSRQVAKGIGISERKAAGLRMQIEGMTTSSLEAYKYYLLGEDELIKIRPPQAHEYFKKAVEIDPNFAMALRRLGGESLEKAMILANKVTEKERLYIEADFVRNIEKNKQKAISLYRKLADRYPKEKNAFLALAVLAPNVREALEMFRKALELDPTDSVALNLGGYCYLQLGQFDQAIDSFKANISARPGDANPLDSLADAYFQSGRLDDALEYYKKALQIDPSFYCSILGTGYIHALREDYSQALSWVDKAVGVSMGNQRPNAYLWKAFYLAWLGSPEKSQGYIQMAKDASKASGHEIEGAYAGWFMAWAYYDQRQLESSRRHNESSLLAFRQDSFYRVSYDFLGGLLDLEEGKIDSAKSRLAEMDSLQAEYGIGNRKFLSEFETEWLRALVFLNDKSLEKALASFQKADASKFAPLWQIPDHLKFRYNTPFRRDDLAKAYAERGEIDKAIAEYTKLITFNPTKPSRALVHPLYHYRLGNLYEQRGLKDKAAEQYKKFLEIWKEADPGSPEVEDAKVRLAKLGT
jgi:serine/threonine protein kinase/tetratricopeptide (TPR) repeat protein